MAWIQLTNIKKLFLNREVFAEVNLSVTKESKVGFVGNNGTGKTTLFKIIMELMDADDGMVVVGNNIRIKYMSQIPTFDGECSVFDEALKSYQYLLDLEKKMALVEEEMVDITGKNLENSLKKHGDLLAIYEQKGGYTYKNKTESVLMGLGFTKDFFTLPASKLSGGQKNRLGLARVLLAPADIVFLDEPTNFLDLESIEWLESELTDTEKAFVVISHDRYFLNKVASNIWELNEQRIISFKGNYDKYKIASELRLQQLQKSYEQQQVEIKRQEEFIVRNMEGQKTKQAQSRRRMLGKIDRINAPAKTQNQMNLFLQPANAGGTVALELKNVGHSYGEKELFKNLNFTLETGEKLAVIGPNGCGKSTLLHIIIQQLEPRTGVVKIGQRSEVGFYHQELKGLDSEESVFDNIKSLIPTMDDGPVRDYLAQFLFRGDDIDKKIHTLSGGEKSKIALARLIIKRPNFLILDEPTNHLDIKSCQALEKALIQYQGSILFVSHDRYFINQVATRLLIYHQNEWIKFNGNYDLFISCRDEILPEKKKNTNKKEKKAYQPPKRLKKKKYNLAKLEEMIIEGEATLEKLSIEMALPKICKNADKMKELKKQFSETQFQLEEWNNEWENWE